MEEIYVLEQLEDFDDYVRSNDVVVTLDKSIISEIVFNILIDENYTPNGYKKYISYRIISWHGRKSKLLLEFGVGGKEETLNFLNTFK
jgi:hypothetical protein